ncbi:uncharacterized protein BXZ73DRAFT_109148 [Epithele typhae]|uniref:uncharacterized protein n=1 Tax=Epithele typhae TaxID=378194 RepID=UPI0020088E57|nr:uncharacterized protein BXZ73DRAFT_109148 [Epithele typhae]KAH9910345.1 hypothetical protein BXZ73DRAFT_109148 [Epithele typhae]
MDWLGLPSHSEHGLYNAFTPLVDGVLDHTEVVGVALMYDLRARDRCVLLDDSHRSPPSLATSLVDFDPDTRPLSYCDAGTGSERVSAMDTGVDVDSAA